MKRVLALTAMVLSMAVATPASAAVVVSGGGSQTINQSFLGFGGTPAVNIPQLTGTLSLSLANVSGSNYIFNYIIDNTSSVASMITGFGFNVDPNISGASSTGLYAFVNTSSNVPNFGTVDVCFNADSSGSCAGAGSGNAGLSPGGGLAQGQLTLNFSGVNSQISLTDFYVRFQGVEGISGVNSAIGRPVTPPVPEPATWAMMLVGFGGIGMAMRRRRQSTKLMQVA